METVLDALKAMKKATYREVAARLDIRPGGDIWNAMKGTR